MMRTALNINQDRLFDIQVWYYLGARTSDNYQKVINKMNTKRDCHGLPCSHYIFIIGISFVSSKCTNHITSIIYDISTWWISYSFGTHRPPRLLILGMS